MGRDPKIAYFFDTECYQSPDGRKHTASAIYYGHKHPMKPHRIAMTHSLLLATPYWPQLKIHRAAPVKDEVIKTFCTDRYFNFLSAKRDFRTWDRLEQIVREGADVHREALDLEEYGIMDDCPYNETIFDFSKSAAAMSIGAAVTLNHGLADVAINWAGGLHHARIDRAEGFCYINDIVLGILELLKYNARVVYIDIDIHHGDGVEEAFLASNRVMTVSFHKFNRGDKEGEDFFFPGTGDVCDIGPLGNHEAKGYTVNVPLTDGLTDEQFLSHAFIPVMTDVMTYFDPQAVVLQSGADSLAKDKIGSYNLSSVGHASAGRWLRAKYPNVPVMVLGGGGYTISNVSRTWAYETIANLGFQDSAIEHCCPIDTFYWEHIRAEAMYEPGAVPFRVSPDPDLRNKNDEQKLSRVINFIRTNIRQFVRPVSVPFAPVAADAISEPAALSAKQDSRA